MRERFQLTRALSQAKAAEGKFPRRDLLKSIKETNLKNKVMNDTYSYLILPIFI